MARKDYSKPANTASRLITKFGGDANLLVDESVPSTNGYDPDPEPLWIPYATQAVLLPLSKDDVAYLAGSTAVETTMKILMEAVELTREVKKDNKIEYKGETWTIRTFKPLKPADIDVLWTLYVGK